MGRFAIVAYRARPGREELLLEAVRDHLTVLRGEGLATDRPRQVMRAADGTVVEVFEWKSAEAMRDAHENAAVKALWERFERACEYTPLRELNECGQLFAEFEALDLNEASGEPA